MTDQDKYLALRKYIEGPDGNGLQYKPMACGWNGCNCFGLVRLFYENERGILLPALEGEETDAGNIAGWFGKEIARAWAPVQTAEWSDCAVFNRGGNHRHVGIMIDIDNMLHIEKGAGVCFEPAMSLTRKNQFAGFYRYVG